MVIAPPKRGVVVVVVVLLLLVLTSRAAKVHGLASAKASAPATTTSSVGGTAVSAPADNDDDDDDECHRRYGHVHRDIAAMLLSRGSSSRRFPRNCRNRIPVDAGDGDDDDYGPDDDDRVGERRRNAFALAVDERTLALSRGGSATSTAPPNDDDDVDDDDDYVLSTAALADLANECDARVFSSSAPSSSVRVPTRIAGLMRLSAATSTYDDRPSSSSAILASTLVALGLLESSVRAVVVVAAGGDTEKGGGGGAPLLRDMIRKMSRVPPRSSSSASSGDVVASASDLAPILRALLLPTEAGGHLNLRNLASHGFLSSIDRRWLSLTLVLLISMDRLLEAPEDADVDDDLLHDEKKDGGVGVKADKSSNGHHPSSTFTKYERLAREVDRGKCILLCPKLMRQLAKRLTAGAGAFVPPSHAPLLMFCADRLAPTIRRSLRDDNEGDAALTAGESTEDKESSNSTDGGLLDSTEGELRCCYPTPLTAIFATVLCSLLEHSLRLLWCRTNGRPRQRIARPSEYYVTLDGHGRRDRHDVLLAPHLRDGTSRNGLIPAIGADAHALLSDLFLSPSEEATNIRSALCHGRWDGEYYKELDGLLASSATRIDVGEGHRRELAERDPSLVDASCALVSCLDLIASNISNDLNSAIGHRTTSYRPVFTYTATAARNLNEIIQNLAALDALISNDSSLGDCIRAMDFQRPKLCEEVRRLKIELGVVKEMTCDLIPMMTTVDDDEAWRVDDIYSEHRTNIALAGNIAALALLGDASRCIKIYVAGVRERKDMLSTMQPSNTKDWRAVKTSAMFWSMAVIAREFYAFTVYVALIALRGGYSQDDTTGNKDWCTMNGHVPDESCNRAEIVRLVERSRMAISTFDCHLTTNIERSIKAVEKYLQGKNVKKLQSNQKGIAQEQLRNTQTQTLYIDPK